MQAIDANAIDNWARTMSAATGSASAATPAAEAATIELWPWLLLMLLLVLSGESMLGNSYLSPLAKVR